MKIGEIMTSNAHYIGPDMSLLAAAEIMRDLNLGVLLVCDHEQLTGIITDRDITIRGVAEARDLGCTPVRAVMSPKIVYAFEDQDVEDAVRLMEVKRIRRLPVLNRDEWLVGIVSLGDIITETGIALSGEALREFSHSEPMVECPS